MKVLISDKANQYKANLHSHSTLSDGKCTPAQIKQMYKQKGYHILAITDHEFPYDHSAMTEPDFLMLTGYECHIRTNENAVYDIYAQEIHLNLFAKQPSNVALIMYSEPYGKYVLRHKPIEKWNCVGSAEVRRYNREYIQKYIDTARENGYLVAYNHPYWSFEDESQIMSYEGLLSMEIRNGGSFSANRLEYNAGLYDRMLRRGKRLFCHAGDDNHNGKEPDSFFAWTYIMALELTYESVISAMEHGDMYSSSGPQIKSLTFDGNRFHVECSPVKQIILYTGSKAPLSVRADENGYVTSADLALDKRAMYARISIFDEYGNSADTRAYFLDELF